MVNTLFLGHMLAPIAFLALVAVVGIITDFIGDKIDEKYENEIEETI